MAVNFASYCLQGLDVFPVALEVDVRQGMPMFSIIGMAGKSVQEAKDRVRSAIQHSGFKFPMTRKVVNLAPAELSKRGSHFDLGIAVGLLIVSGQMHSLPKDVLLIGELGLEGGVRAVSGILPAVVFAKENGIQEVILPMANLKEASLVDEIDLIPVKSLREVVDHFEVEAKASQSLSLEIVQNIEPWDFGDISGHAAAKQALLIAAAGGHHVLMSGPPGSGKSLLARCFSSILPPLSRAELLEVLRIYSVAGQTLRELSLRRPFRRVHHSCSPAGLIGGGVDLMPGEVSLAHQGVLFMDELPEFDRRTLEMLREPLEEKDLLLRRGGRVSTYPCQFQLIAAMNPCPCGNYGDGVKRCVCSGASIARYQSKISGSLLDRIDLHVEVPRISYDELTGAAKMNSASMRAMVIEARERQRARGLGSNQEMGPAEVKVQKFGRGAEKVLQKATDTYGLSGRRVHRLIKVARTIADLEGVGRIEKNHLMEALPYRVE